MKERSSSEWSKIIFKLLAHDTKNPYGLASLVFHVTKAFDFFYHNSVKYWQAGVFIYFLVGGVVEEIPWVSVLTLRLHRR